MTNTIETKVGAIIFANPSHSVKPAIAEHTALDGTRFRYKITEPDIAEDIRVAEKHRMNIADSVEKDNPRYIILQNSRWISHQAAYVKGKRLTFVAEGEIRELIAIVKQKLPDSEIIEPDYGNYQDVLGYQKAGLYEVQEGREKENDKRNTKNA